MHSQEVRAKLSALERDDDSTRIRPPPSASWRERPKSEEWKRGQSERSRKMWENPEAYGLPPRRHWTDEEIALLGTDTDRAIANRLGLPKKVVTNERERLGIPGLSQRWKEHEIALLGTAPDSEARTPSWENLRRPSGRKREQLGIPAFLNDGRTRRSP